MERPTILYKKGTSVRLDLNLTADAIQVDEHEVPAYLADGWVRNPYTDLKHEQASQEHPKTQVIQATAVIRESSEGDATASDDQAIVAEEDAPKGGKRK